MIDIALEKYCNRIQDDLKGFPIQDDLSAYRYLTHGIRVRVYNKYEYFMRTNKQILLVDDDSSLRSTLRVCLEAVGYQCHEARDGYEAKEWMKGSLMVDLIVIDHQMPRISGLELIKKLKSHKGTKAIPIIFYSGEITAQLRNQAIQVGVNAVLEKPFPLQDFLDLVAQLCGNNTK